MCKHYDLHVGPCFASVTHVAVCVRPLHHCRCAGLPNTCLRMGKYEFKARAAPRSPDALFLSQRVSESARIRGIAHLSQRVPESART